MNNELRSYLPDCIIKYIILPYLEKSSNECRTLKCDNKKTGKKSWCHECRIKWKYRFNAAVYTRFPKGLPRPKKRNILSRKGLIRGQHQPVKKKGNIYLLMRVLKKEFNIETYLNNI